MQTVQNTDITSYIDERFHDMDTQQKMFRTKSIEDNLWRNKQERDFAKVL